MAVPQLLWVVDACHQLKGELSKTDLLVYFYPGWIRIQDIEGPTTLDIGRMPVVTYATRHRG